MAETETEIVDAAEPSFDMDSAVESIGKDLFDASPPPAKEDHVEEVPAPAESPPPPDAAEPLTAQEATPPASVAKEPPKSWAKEQHERWGKLDPDTQAYIELREKQMADGVGQVREEATLGRTLKEVLTPYKSIIAAQGLNEPQAVSYLLNAHYKLTQGSPESRAAAYRQLGAELGLTPADPNAPPVDPQIKALQDQMTRLESGLTLREQSAFTDARAKVSLEVEHFAADPKHAYFNDVADDIVPFIQAGAPLEQAYEKAVWANPVTRQKEIARLQTEQTAALHQKAKTEADAAKRGTQPNVKGRESPRAPTEPKGTMDDTLRDTLKAIKARELTP